MNPNGFSLQGLVVRGPIFLTLLFLGIIFFIIGIAFTYLGIQATEKNLTNYKADKVKKQNNAKTYVFIGCGLIALSGFLIMISFFVH